MSLSPLAHLILQHHRARPDQPMYDVAVLGSGFREQDLDQVAQAYQELESGKFVEATGDVERLFNHFFYLYRPTNLGNSGISAETASTGAV